MNQQQKTYFIKRIDEVINRKINEAGRSTDAPIQYLSNLSAGERQADWLESGELKLSINSIKQLKAMLINILGSSSHWTSSASNYGTMDIGKFLTEESVLKCAKLDAQREKEYSQIKDYLIRRIRKDGSKAKDVVMFGEEKEALQVLENFAKTDHTDYDPNAVGR